ncbi:hypothetical protein TNCV_4522871, partial [Trichonephila clavipes]
MCHQVILSLGRVQLKMSRQPTPQNHTSALSTGIKANHPRLSDGCSGR